MREKWKGQRMQSKKVMLDGVGEILLERSARARHINLSVKPFRGIRVAVPKGVSFQEAFAVARDKSPWLARHLARMARVEQMVREREIETDLTPSQVRSVLVERLDLLAERYGFRYNRVFVRPLDDLRAVDESYFERNPPAFSTLLGRDDPFGKSSYQGHDGKRFAYAGRFTQT